MLDDLMRDLAYGARLLRRSPGFATLRVNGKPVRVAGVLRDESSSSQC